MLRGLPSSPSSTLPTGALLRLTIAALVIISAFSMVSPTVLDASLNHGKASPEVGGEFGALVQSPCMC
jgi:hypothetical protein